MELVLSYFEVNFSNSYHIFLDFVICSYNSFIFMFSNIPAVFWIIRFNLSLLLIYETSSTLLKRLGWELYHGNLLLHDNTHRILNTVKLSSVLLSGGAIKLNK